MNHSKHEHRKALPSERLTPSTASSPTVRPRFLSDVDCHALLQRLERVTEGGGTTGVMIWSTWSGNVRWARNLIDTSGEVRNDYIRVSRNLNGAQSAWMLINDLSDAALVAAARRAERLVRLRSENPQGALYSHFVEESATPTAPLFFDATYAVDAAQRAATAQQLAQTATTAGMLSAGYIEVAAHSMAVLDTAGHTRYVNYTTAQYSVTVRDPTGTGSGWAGVDWPDWTRIDGARLTAIALDKCLKSCNPVAVEPGRYTTILEPQAVCDFVSPMVGGDALGRALWIYQISSDGPTEGPFGSQPPSYKALLGRQVIDPRLTISADLMDPDLAFPNFNPAKAYDFEDGFILDYEVYHPVTWIEHGVLKTLAYRHEFAVDNFGTNTGLPNSGAFRMSVTGPTASVEEMIATTKRGLLVTRFSEVIPLEYRSQLQRGYTRDGLWLIENGTISKPVKNMAFTESILFALNNIEQLGVSQRVFHPKPDGIYDIPQPVIVPPMKIKDFSFTSLADAV